MAGIEYLLQGPAGAAGAAGATGPAGTSGLKAMRSARVTNGDLAVSASTSTWHILDANLDLVLPAAIGDVIEYSVAMWWAASTLFAALDVITAVAGAQVNTFSGQSLSGTDFGCAGLGAANGNVQGEPVAGTVLYTIVSGDLSAGNVTLRLANRVDGASGTRTLFRNTHSPVQVWAKNLGPSVN